jgi:S-formylglutathione hydrolase FrmB
MADCLSIRPTSLAGRALAPVEPLRSPTVTGRLVLAALAMAAMAVVAPGLNGRVVNGTLASSAGPISYDVYLPPGYDASTGRYPVVYYLHGLPANAGSFHGVGYVAAALERGARPAIVVAPQGATAADSDPEYLDLGPGRQWDTAIAVELPRAVDAAYRTIPDRSGRAIVGVSAGGYGAMMLGLHHLALFSAIESWSGYFHPTDPDGVHSISDRPWWSAHTFVSSLRRAFLVHPTFLGFYVGAADTLFRGENVQFARELSRAHVPFTFRIYPGGHAQSLWSAQAPSWLSQALAWLRAAG